MKVSKDVKMYGKFGEICEKNHPYSFLYMGGGYV